MGLINFHYNNTVVLICHWICYRVKRNTSDSVNRNNKPQNVVWTWELNNN